MRKQAFSKLLSTRDPNPGKKGDKSEKRKEGVLSLGDILKQVQKGRVESRVCHWSNPISEYCWGCQKYKYLRKSICTT